MASPVPLPSDALGPVAKKRDRYIEASALVLAGMYTATALVLQNSKQHSHLGTQLLVLGVFTGSVIAAIRLLGE